MGLTQGGRNESSKWWRWRQGWIFQRTGRMAKEERRDHNKCLGMEGWMEGEGIHQEG